MTGRDWSKAKRRQKLSRPAPTSRRKPAKGNGPPTWQQLKLIRKLCAELELPNRHPKTVHLADVCIKSLLSQKRARKQDAA